MGVKNLKFFKKNIVIVLLMVLTFNLSSTYFLARNSKKVEGAEIAVAVALGYAGVSFTAFTAFAQTVYFNGYHMQISEIMTTFVNQYYDYANGVYLAKASKMTVLDKLSLMTASVLSGNNYMPLSELEVIKNDLATALPPKIDITGIVPLSTVYINSPVDFRTYLVNNQGFQTFKPEYINQYIRLQYDATMPDYYCYIKTSNIDWHLWDNYYYPVVQIIEPNGKVHTANLNKYMRMYYYSAKQTFNLNFMSDTSSIRFSVIDMVRDNFYEVNPSIPYTTTDDSYSTGSRDFDVPYGNYLHAVSGKATTPEELQGLMNTDNYLQNEITKLLETQAVNEKNELVAPVVGVDGTLNYGGVTDVPTDSTGSFSTALTGFWNNYLVNPVTGLWDTVKTLPDVISSAWDTSMDVPLESIQLSNLQLDGIITRFPFSIPFDFIRVLSVINVSPVAPDLSFNINTKYLKISHTIDSRPMDIYIKFFRWFVILTFTIGLMFLTGKVIKW